MNWCEERKCCIANALFDKRPAKLVTHVRKNSKRQIDFAMVDAQLKGCLTNCESCQDIPVGSDHFALKWAVKFSQWKRKKNKTRKPQMKKMIGWKAKDEEEYALDTDEAFGEFRMSERWVNESFDEKCKQIEETLVQIAQGHLKENENATVRVDDSTLKTLIKERQEYRSEEWQCYEAAALVSKYIQRETRTLNRRRKRTEIQQILK